MPGRPRNCFTFKRMLDKIAVLAKTKAAIFIFFEPGSSICIKINEQYVQTIESVKTSIKKQNSHKNTLKNNHKNGNLRL